MMGRLFWKIFFWFWVALFLLNLGVGWGVKLYYGQVQEAEDRQLQSRMAEIAHQFEAGNIREARRLLEIARREDGTRIFVIDERGLDFLNRPLPRYVTDIVQEEAKDWRNAHRVEATLPRGGKIELIGLYRPSWVRSFRNTPIAIVFGIMVVISTLVCYWLARYLSSPILRLRNATRQLAAGRLEVRVGKSHRKDEIADLAVDFDLMADKIQTLLSSQKQLLQDISHELRSPLARLQVALALAKRKGADQDTAYERIAKDLNRLEELIGEVLTLARLETVTYPRETVAISELVGNIVEDCRLEAESRGCTIALQCEPDLRLEGSVELLRRAIENVLRNAVKFTAPATEISVAARKVPGGLAIDISDRGPGIPEESRDRMFEAFVRIDAARTHKPGGYGLGLAIARKAIEIHGGNIQAANRSDGGLTVTIALPA